MNVMMINEFRLQNDDKWLKGFLVYAEQDRDKGGGGSQRAPLFIVSMPQPATWVLQNGHLASGNHIKHKRYFIISTNTLDTSS